MNLTTDVDATTDDLTVCLELISTFRASKEPSFLLEVVCTEDTPLTELDEVRSLPDTLPPATDLPIRHLLLEINDEITVPVAVIELELDGEGNPALDHVLQVPSLTVLYIHDGDVLDVVLGVTGTDQALQSALTLRFSGEERRFVLEADLVYVQHRTEMIAAWANSHSPMLP